MTEDLLSTAYQLTQHGISVVATDSDKIPVGGKWGHFQDRIASEDELKRMFDNKRVTGIATIGGQVSGNLYNMDFEGKDHNHNPMSSVYPQWEDRAKAALREMEMENLFEKIIVTKTQNGGYHGRWRVAGDVELKNGKLAKRWAVSPDTGKVLTDKNGRPIADLLIESKGKGGYALCPPSPGYELIQGNLTQIPVFPVGVHEILVWAARSLHTAIDPKSRVTSEEYESKSPPRDSDSLRPGDDYNQRENWRPLIEDEGWELVHESGGKEF